MDVLIDIFAYATFFLFSVLNLEESDSTRLGETLCCTEMDR